MLNNMTIAAGATGATVTGGTAKTYTPDGQSVFNGIHVADNTVADFRVKPHFTFKNRNPVRQSDGTFSKGKRDIVSTDPYLDVATGIVHYVTTRYSQEANPVIPAANCKDARLKMAQCLFDSDCENFHATGDIS